MSNTDVLIVGAGPTGVTLACDLARRGISLRIIDKSPDIQNGSRAKALQPRSLEVFDDLGIAGEMLASGKTDTIYRRFKGSQVIGESKRSDIATHRNDTAYPLSLLIPQTSVERILRAKLKALGITVEFAKTLEGFTEENDGVLVNIGNAANGEKLVCKYLVGCDGGHSATRKALGIKFEGVTSETETAIIGDVEVEGLTPDAWHMWLHPLYGIGIALCPLPGTNLWQLQAAAVPDSEGNAPVSCLETFNRVFQENAAMPGVILKNAGWVSTYRVNVRMADKFKVGRIFIAGDAAHAHSIAGGLGMNTGIQDAYNLGWKLAAVLTGAAKPKLLETYEEERLPVAAWTLNTSTARQMAVIDASKKGQGGIESAITKDTTQLNIHFRDSSLSFDARNERGNIAAGDRAPDATCKDAATGNPIRLFDIFRGTHFTVLGFGIKYKEALTGMQDAFAPMVKACLVAASFEPGMIQVLLDNNGTAAAAYGLTEAAFVIRPDGYIGFATCDDDSNAIADYLGRFMKRDN